MVAFTLLRLLTLELQTTMQFENYSMLPFQIPLMMFVVLRLLPWHSYSSRTLNKFQGLSNFLVKVITHMSAVVQPLLWASLVPGLGSKMRLISLNLWPKILWISYDRAHLLLWEWSSSNSPMWLYLQYHPLVIHMRKSWQTNTKIQWLVSVLHWVKV